MRKACLLNGSPARWSTSNLRKPFHGHTSRGYLARTGVIPEPASSGEESLLSLRETAHRLKPVPPGKPISPREPPHPESQPARLQKSASRSARSRFRPRASPYARLAGTTICHFDPTGIILQGFLESGNHRLDIERHRFSGLAWSCRIRFRPETFPCNCTAPCRSPPAFCPCPPS